MRAAIWQAVAGCVSAALFAPASGQEAKAASESSARLRLEEETTVSELERIAVTATRTERAIEDVAASVDAIDRERMNRELANDLEDLFRYEPGISVRSGFGRFGIGDLRIRGLDGNRVLLEVDGIPLPDAFAIGSFSSAGRDLIDPDALRQVEILRGPASPLYGSDALGGVVAFMTKDPEDYLAVSGHSRYLGLKIGYRSEDRGGYATATYAAGGEQWSGLLVATRRDGSELDNQGENDSAGRDRTRPNPQNTGGWPNWCMRPAWISVFV